MRSPKKTLGERKSETKGTGRHRSRTLRTCRTKYFKYGIEIRIKSVNKDDSHSWVSDQRNGLPSTGPQNYATPSQNGQQGPSMQLPPVN